MPFVFPDFVNVPIPARFNAKKVNGGYTVSRTGLIGILTNTAYIGYWSFDGVVTSKNNHAAIVDESDFWYAFNRLSDTTPDGDEQERIGTLPTRFNHATTIPLDALLRDVLASDGMKVYIDTVNKTYRAVNYANTFDYRSFSLSSTSVDQAFTQRLIWRLKQEHKSGTADIPDAMNTRLKAIQSDKQRQATSVDEQLEKVNSRIVVLRRNLDLPDVDTETLTGWTRELKHLVNSVKPALESKINAVETSKKEAAEFKTLLERVKNDWNGLMFDEKRRFVNMITSRVVMSEVSPHLIKLQIYWSELWNARGGEMKWSDEEQAVLREMYPAADRFAILNRLPSRSWEMIRNFTRRNMDISRDKHNNLNTSPLHSSLSVKDSELLKNIGVAFTDELLKGKCEWVAVSSKSDSLL